MSDTVDADWRPTPKFVLRNACIERATAGWAPGTFLECGAGTGTLTRAFLDRGFTGVCHDITEGTRDILRKNLAHRGDTVRVVEHLDTLDAESFDYLFAFEVLEHIDDDLGTLRQWTKYLRPGGRLLVSVPSHQRKYGPEDAAVGHVRRYERDDLEALFAGAGYGDITILNYGFPLGNVTRMTRRILDEVRRHDDDDRPFTERSVDSGVKTTEALIRISPLVNRRVLAPFILLQRPFFRRGLGDGYVATATKHA